MNAVLRFSNPMPGPDTAPLPAAPAGRRYLALWLPFLPADRQRQGCAAPDERPLVLVEKQRGALRLAALDARAVRLGLRPGMALAEARALTPDLAVADLAPEKDAQALRIYADAALRFTPLVALDGADGLMLDITGCAHLFGGEAGLFGAARAQMRRFGLTVRAAIATTPEAAHAFARFTQGGVAPPGGEAAIARRLPVEALEVPAEIALALTRAGLRCLGDLADRPSQALAARFGGEITARLNGIFGLSDRRITPLRSPPDIMAERHFAEPLALFDSLLASLERLAGDIAGRLEARGEGGRVFEASFLRSDGAVRRIPLETARGMRDVRGLMRLFRLRLDSLADPLDPGFGFDAIRLAVLRSETLEQRQEDLVAGCADPDEARAIAGLADRLIARFGRENVRRLITADTHDPVRAATSIPYTFEPACALLPPPLPPSLPVPERGEPPARPLTLFERPQPIDVVAEVPDGPPVRFRWRRILHAVARAEGPERIAPEWWRPEDTFLATRDYYRVEDAEGQRFWLFREGLYEAGAHPRWYVHGLFA